MTANTKVTFTYGGRDLIVTHRKRGSWTDRKSGEVREGWVRDGDSRHYSLDNMEWCTVDNLLREWHCTSGESTDELFALFGGIKANLERIAARLDGKIEEHGAITVTFGEEQ